MLFLFVDRQTYGCQACCYIPFLLGDKNGTVWLSNAVMHPKAFGRLVVMGLTVFKVEVWSISSCLLEGGRHEQEKISKQPPPAPTARTICPCLTVILISKVPWHKKKTPSARLQPTLHPKNADGITNSVDPGQTAHLEQSEMGLYCLLRPICPNTKYFKVFIHSVKG